MEKWIAAHKKTYENMISKIKDPVAQAKVTKQFEQLRDFLPAEMKARSNPRCLLSAQASCNPGSSSRVNSQRLGH